MCPQLTTFCCGVSVQSPLPQNEGSRLESLRSFRILGTACEQVFDDIVHLAALICDTPVAIIAFIDEQRVWLKAKIGLELDEIPRDGSFCACAILQSDVLIVPDPLSDERFMDSFLVKQIGIQFYAGIPLIADDAHPLGTLAVMDRVPHLLTAEQIDSLQILDRRLSVRRAGYYSEFTFRVAFWPRLSSQRPLSRCLPRVRLNPAIELTESCEMRSMKRSSQVLRR